MSELFIYSKFIASKAVECLLNLFLIYLLQIQMFIQDLSQITTEIKRVEAAAHMGPAPV